MKRVDILGVPFDNLTSEELEIEVRRLRTLGASGWIGFSNVHAVNLAHDLPWFRSFLQDALINCCDGEGVRLGAAIAGTPIVERIAMSDWIYELCRLAADLSIPVFFLGGEAQVLRKAVEKLQSMVPGLPVAGMHHGFFQRSEEAEINRLIEESGAEWCLVAMGMPMQEEWILRNRGFLPAKIFWIGGGALDFVSGRTMRAPRWLQHFALEWLFRLLLEPRRLWKRYLIGNPKFLLRILRASARKP